MVWSCHHCTFENDDKRKRCSMCRKGQPAAEAGPSLSPRPQRMKKRRGPGQGGGNCSNARHGESSSSDADEDDSHDDECDEVDETNDLSTSADPIEVLDSSDDDKATSRKTSPGSIATSVSNARGGRGNRRKKSSTASGSAMKGKDTAGKPKGQMTKRKRVRKPASSDEDGGEDTDVDVQRSQSVKKARGGAVVGVEDDEGDVFAFTEESPLKPPGRPKGSRKPAVSAVSSSTSLSAKPKQDSGQQRKLDTFLVPQDGKAPQKSRQQTVRVVSAGYVDDDDDLLDDPTKGLTVGAVVKVAKAPPTTRASPESPASRQKAPRPALSPATSTSSSSVPSPISVVHALNADDVATSKRRKDNDGRRSSSGDHGDHEERQGAEEGGEEGETSDAMLQLLLQGEPVNDGSDVELSLVRRRRHSSDAAQHHHLYTAEDIIDSIETRRRKSCPAPRSSCDLRINSHSPRQSPAKPYAAAAGGGQGSVLRNFPPIIGPSIAARGQEKAAAGAFAWTLEEDDGDDEDEAAADGQPETSRRTEQGPSSPATSDKATSEVSSTEGAGAHPSSLKATVRGEGAGERPVEEVWSCRACTYDNEMSNEDCEVCDEGKRPTLKSSASKTIVSGMNSVIVVPPRATPQATATSSPNGGPRKPGAQEARSSAGCRTAQEFLSEVGQGADSMDDSGARHHGNLSDAVDEWGEEGDGEAGEDFMSEQNEDGEDEIDDDLMLDEEASDGEYEASIPTKNENAVKELLDLTCTDDEIEAFSDHDDSQRLRGPDHPQLPHFRSIQRLRESRSNTVDWSLMTDGGGRATRGVTQANYNERRKRRDVKNANSNNKKKKKSGRGQSKGGWRGGWRGRRGRGGKTVRV